MKLKINVFNMGIVLMSIYIFMTYNAMNLIIPMSFLTPMLIVFLAWGILTMVTAREKRKLTTYTAWYICFMMLSILIMTYSPEFSIFTGEFYLMIVSFMLTFFFQLFVRSEKTFDLICWVYALSSAILVISLIFTGNMIADANNRLGLDIMGNANTFAGMLMVGVMYAIWLLIYNKNTVFEIVLLCAVIILDYYALIFSAGRKFFLLPIIFLYIQLLYRKDKAGRRHIIKYTLFIGIIVAVIIYMLISVPVFYETIGYRFETLIMGYLGMAEQGASAALRETLQEIAIDKWLSSPIWGYGFDSFKYYSQDVTGAFIYSHCNFTELLYNGGIIYFFAYYSIYWIVFKKIFFEKLGKIRHQAFAVGVMISFLIFDYGGVSYSMANLQCMMALALSALNLKPQITKEVRYIHE